MEQHLRGERSVVVLELIGGDTAVHVVDVQYQPPSVSLGDVLRSPEEIKPIGKGIGVVADVHRLHVHPVLKVNVFVGVLALCTLTPILIGLVVRLAYLSAEL